MTETERKALALVNEVRDAGRNSPTTLYEMRSDYTFKALCRAIEAHDAFRQEVSDACKKWTEANVNCREPHDLDRFIIAKPDPLVEAVDELWTQDSGKAKYMADQLRAYLTARGLKIVEVGHD